jgi:hypothetical protein
VKKKSKMNSNGQHKVWDDQWEDQWNSSLMNHPSLTSHTLKQLLSQC